MTLRNSLTLLLLLGSWPATAEAFCRTRTCDVDDSCAKDDDGCSIGTKTRWPNGCIEFSVQRDGSTSQHISARDTLKLAEDAFAVWTDSECHHGGTPPLTFIEQGEVGCHQPEYNCNPDDWNSNVIMFQDDGWDHSAAAIAITCVTMNLDTGEILDADIEINTPFFEFALPGESNGRDYDLRTVLMHEAGHVLGLDHAHLPGAVMHEYNEQNLLVSSLSDDDIAGVCEIYGGEEDDPECHASTLPKDTDCVGASECVPLPPEDGCSCRVGAAGRAGTTFWGLCALAAAVLLGRRSARSSPRSRACR